MLDAPVRPVLDRPLSELARLIDIPFVSPNRLTLLGLAAGLASAAAAATQLWWWALGLWLFSRAMDGLDGPLARRRRAAAAGITEASPGSEGSTRSEAGGFLDIMADFTVYGATVVSVAIGATGQYGVGCLPFLAVLLAYYVNGSAFLAFSSIAARTGRERDDGRSLSFLGGLAEGTETIAVHSLWLVIPPGRRDRHRVGGDRRRQCRPAHRRGLSGPVLTGGRGPHCDELARWSRLIHQVRRRASTPKARWVVGRWSCTWTSAIAAFQGPSL